MAPLFFGKSMKNYEIKLRKTLSLVENIISTYYARNEKEDSKKPIPKKEFLKIKNFILSDSNHLPSELTECPDCHEISVRAKGWHEGGGIVCINPDCNYWFCY